MRPLARCCHGVPVFIVAGGRDPFAAAKTVGVPMHEMHELCPTSELLRLPRATHTALFDHAETIGEGVEDFLTRRLHDARAVVP